MEVQINGFPNYTITNSGDIFNLNYNNTKTKRKLKPLNNGSGYMYVCLCRNGKKYNKYIHILVAEHFIPNPNNLPQVNHKDGDKTNCHDWNLEWCTNGENLSHAHRISLRDDREHLIKISQISSNATSKPVLQLYNNGSIKAEFKNAGEASIATGANRRKIYECCNGKQKTCGGWKWKYKEV